MPSSHVKDFLKNFNPGKVIAVRLRRFIKDRRTKRNSTTTHYEGDDTISADIPTHPGSLARDSDINVSFNISSARSSHGDSSARKASDMAQTYLPLVQAVAGACPLVGAPINATIGGLLEIFQVMNRRGQNKEDLDSLASQLHQLQGNLCNAPPTQDHRERSRRENLTSILLETSDKLTELHKRSLASPSLTQDITGCFKKIDRYMAEYLLSSQMQNGDDIRALMAILERQQEDHQRQREMLMRIESHILRVQSSVGPNITLGFVKLVDATDHSHAIPMDVCDSFERFKEQLQLLFKYNSIEARIQRRYMEQGQYDLVIDDDRTITRLTSHEWPSIEAGTTIVMRVVFEQQTSPRVDFRCHFCDAVNDVGAGSIMDSLERQAGCSIDCRVCKRRFQISRGSASAKRNSQSSNIDPVPRTEAEMHLIRNFLVQQINSQSVKPRNDHPRTMLNNELQKKYGSSAPMHVAWRVYSQGPPDNLTWHATVYIDDMNYGYATARTSGGAQDRAANMASNYLRRERSSRR